jgi:hypothetical protein
LENTAEKRQEKVTHYTPQQAKKVFNANTAFKYTFTLLPTLYLKENGIKVLRSYL